MRKCEQCGNLESYNRTNKKSGTNTVFTNSTGQRWHGPDLVLKRGSSEITVEVKSVSKTRDGRYIVGAVAPRRKNDDYICFVFHNGKIVVQPMQYHLALCSKIGMRSIPRTVLHAP